MATEAAAAVPSLWGGLRLSAAGWAKAIGRTFGLVAPEAAPARRVARTLGRQARLYAFGSIDRLNGDWVTVTSSSDSEIRLTLRMMRNRSRQLCRDNDYAKSLKRVIRNNVVGQGVRFQAQVKKRDGSLNTDVNDKIEQEFADWCENCEVSGRTDFQDIEGLIINEVFESGECLIRLVPQAFGNSRVPLGLELIEADQLVDEWSGKADNGNEVRMGIEVDQWKRPVAYWMYPKHPGDYMFAGAQLQTNRFLRVPAEEIIHLFIPDRFGDTRGVPWMHTAGGRLRHMGGYEEALVVKARASACVMGIIETPEVTDPTQIQQGTPETQDLDDGEQVMDLAAGTVRKLAAGEKFTGFNPAAPDANADPFLRYLIRSVCAGVGTSYESVSKDYTNTSYSSARASRLDEIDNWKVIQRWLIRHFHTQVGRRWMDLAVLAGVLPFPDYETNPLKYREVRWTPRGWQLLDPAKEVPAQRSAIRAGLATLFGTLESQGIDPDEHLHARRRELDECGELELIFDTDPAQVTDRGQQVVSEDPLATPDQVPNDEKGAGEGSAESGAPGKKARAQRSAKVVPLPFNVNGYIRALMRNAAQGSDPQAIAIPAPVMVRGVDVPYVAGMSEDGAKCYFDIRLKPLTTKSGINFDPAEFIAVHELVEWTLVKRFNLTYEDAHIHATRAEHAAVAARGIDPAEYEELLQNLEALCWQLAKAGEMEHIPKDLARYPYEADNETYLLAA